MDKDIQYIVIKYTSLEEFARKLEEIANREEVWNVIIVSEHESSSIVCVVKKERNS
jgi:hypothetical protein